MARSSFIKAATTSTSVASSRSELEKMLRRYGASSFQVAQDFTTRRASVSFIVPDDPAHPAAKIPVRLFVETERVALLLYGKKKGARFNTTQLERAERVAWRNLILWVDAALSAASIGMQTITEAFFAHTVVGIDGERMIEVVGAYQQQLGSGVQRLLTSTAEAE